MKDVGITRNSDLEEYGVDEYAHLDKKKSSKKKVKETSNEETKE